MHFHSRKCIWKCCLEVGGHFEWLILNVLKRVTSNSGTGILTVVKFLWCSIQKISSQKAFFPGTWTWLFTVLNSLVPGKFEWNFIYVIFKWIDVIDGWGIACEIALIWMSLDFTDMSILVQVMAWCRQATSHYMSQCWPRSLSPYGVTRPEWVNSLQCLCH